jgi:hypothetical protein
MAALATTSTTDENPRPVSKLPVPPDILERVHRARQDMRKDASQRRLCVKFWQNEPYWYVNPKGSLSFLPTALVDVEGGKPRHRIRNSYNFIHSIVEGKVSAASQRVPGYEVDPSSADQEDVEAARISQQVAFYGYDKWRLRRQTTKAITNALVQREGFIMPYFDADVAPYRKTPEGVKGTGEIKFLNLTRSQVGWEPGVDFEDSPFWIIERALTPEEIRSLPGFIGVPLVTDASTTDAPSERKSDRMVVVTEYLERPCRKYPDGRRWFLANEGGITDARRNETEPSDGRPWEKYPCFDVQGNVVDELIIHRLSYTVDPEGDDRGLVEQLLSLQMTINDCWNKLLEWKNRTLMPQMSAPRGANVTRRDDTPGATWYYNVIAGQKPEWERTPPVPRELFDMLDLAIAHMRAIAADVDASPEPDLAAKTLAAAIEQSRARWQSFLGDLAEFHSRLMRHCLMLVSRYYTEERIIQIRGQYGWEPVRSFTGMDLRSQTNVRVLPGSIETKTRAQVLQEVQFIQANWPGAISPEAAMAAIHGGSAEALLKSYTLDVARAWKMVQLFRQGPDAVLNMPERQDPTLGPVPAWMPRKQDNIAIHKQVVGDYMKSDDFDRQPPPTQEMFNLYWEGLEWTEQQRALQIAQQQMQTASDLGMQNAARPQSAAPLPNVQAGLSPQQAAPDALSPA